MYVCMRAASDLRSPTDHPPLTKLIAIGQAITGSRPLPQAFSRHSIYCNVVLVTLICNDCPSTTAIVIAAAVHVDPVAR